MSTEEIELTLHELFDCLDSLPEHPPMHGTKAIDAGLHRGAKGFRIACTRLNSLPLRRPDGDIHALVFADGLIVVSRVAWYALVARP